MDILNQIPPVTRTYMAGAIICSIGVSLKILSPLDLYLNYDLVFRKYQFWRLLTTFTYLGPLSMNLIIHFYFFHIYASNLEQATFHGRRSGLIFMYALMVIAFLLVSPFIGSTVNFLSQPLSLTIMYVWARKNPFEQMRLYGLFTLSAAYLPFLILLFNYISNPQGFLLELFGLFLGHTYYYLTEVVPHVFEVEPLKTPTILKQLFDDQYQEPMQQYQEPMQRHQEPQEHIELTDEEEDPMLD